MRRRQNGFSLFELLVVVVIIGILAGIGMPRFRDGMYRESVRNARRAVSQQLSRARAVASARGCRSVLHIIAGPDARVWVTACPLAGTGVDTVGAVDYLSDRFSVTVVKSGPDSVPFAPTGVGIAENPIKMAFRSNRATYSNTIEITPVGKAIW